MMAAAARHPLLGRLLPRSGDLTLSDAIDDVVARLPAGCGPAIQGTAADVVRAGADEVSPGRRG